MTEQRKRSLTDGTEGKCPNEAVEAIVEFAICEGKVGEDGGPKPSEEQREIIVFLDDDSTSYKVIPVVGGAEQIGGDEFFDDFEELAELSELIAWLEILEDIVNEAAIEDELHFEQPLIEGGAR